MIPFEPKEPEKKIKKGQDSSYDETKIIRRDKNKEEQKSKAFRQI